jgi:hypothetical protein
MDRLPAPTTTNIALSNGRSIGGCPEDEYDGYVRKIAAMHRDNASDEELLEYLKWPKSRIWAAVPLRVLTEAAP